MIVAVHPCLQVVPVREVQANAGGSLHRQHLAPGARRPKVELELSFCYKRPVLAFVPGRHMCFPSLAHCYPRCGSSEVPP